MPHGTRFTQWAVCSFQGLKSTGVSHQTLQFIENNRGVITFATATNALNFQVQLELEFDCRRIRFWLAT